MVNQTKELIIIGGGPAGLAAAIEAYRNGIKPDDILIIERDRELGGILNQCIHAGFGLHLFGEELTGTEYSGKFIKEIEETKIGFVTDSMVLSVSDDKVVTFVSPKLGFCHMKAKAIILAMGCRERTRGALNIPGSRPAGIFSAGTAQRYVNIEGYMPGKKVVILGSGDIGLIMARRLTLEGAKVLKVCEIMPYSGGLARNIAQCLNDFDIPLCLSHTVTEIKGRDRLEGVVIAKVDENRMPIKSTEEYIECDTLLLSVGLIPENELSKSAGVVLDKITGGAVVNQFMETSVDGIFACGNVLHVHDLVDFVTREAYVAGAAAADCIKGNIIRINDICQCKTGDGIRYIVPQKLIKSQVDKGTRLFFRVDNIYRNVKLIFKVDGVVVHEIDKKVLSPGEMENIKVNDPILTKLKNAETIEISIAKMGVV